MKKAVIISISIVLVLAVAVIAGLLYFFSTPEYALLQLKEEYEDSGMDGIQSYFTGEARDMVQNVSEKSDGEDIVTAVIRNMVDMGVVENNGDKLTMEWEVVEIIKGSSRAAVIVKLECGDLDEDIEITMVRKRSGWKINGINLSVFGDILGKTGAKAGVPS